MYLVTVVLSWTGKMAGRIAAIKRHSDTGTASLIGTKVELSIHEGHQPPPYQKCSDLLKLLLNVCIMFLLGNTLGGTCDKDMIMLVRCGWPITPVGAG
jgi:hypothetical protein